MADRHGDSVWESRLGPRAWLRVAPENRLVSLVRRGEETAFEHIYDRHSRELLAFCRYMLGSQHDAEDAVQNTFASAYRALRADDRAVALRPWLFAIARNECLSVLRQRRPCTEIRDAPAPREDPSDRVQQREDLRDVLASLGELPERQRAALVLSELHGFGHRDIAALLGVRTEQIKAYVFQARTSLVSERLAHGADCGNIRAQLATARGAALLRGHLRRHVRVCAGCRDYAAAVSRQRRQLAILLPVAPSLALKRRSLQSALGRDPSVGAYAGGAAGGVSVAATTVEIAGGGVKALLAKMLAGVALVGAGSSAGAVVVGAIAARPAPGSGSDRVSHLAASVGPARAADQLAGGAGQRATDGGAPKTRTTSLKATSGALRPPVAAGGKAGNKSSRDSSETGKPESGAKGREQNGSGAPGKAKGNGSEGGVGKGKSKGAEGNPGKGKSKGAEGNPGKGKSKGAEGNPGKGKGAEGNPGKGNGPEGNPGSGVAGGPLRAAGVAPGAQGSPPGQPGAGGAGPPAPGGAGGGGSGGSGHGEHGVSAGTPPEPGPHKH
jgi:RNA polymerase sigma factor (sigma-70 family)